MSSNWIKKMAINKKTEREMALEFGLILAVALGLLALAWQTGFWRFELRPDRAKYVFMAIPIISLVALFIKPLWQRIFDLWMKLAHALSFVMTRVLLTVFFFLVITPIGLFMRMIGHRPLDLSWKDGRSSYWIDKPPGEYTLERYKKQF